MKIIDLLREPYEEYNRLPKKEKSKWTALLLCLFFGFLGAHKFYEGKPTVAVLYACTAGLFGFGWLKDTITYILFTPYVYTP